MFCTKCGNQLDTDALFCTSCGNKVLQNSMEEKGSSINISISKDATTNFFKVLFSALKSPSSSVSILNENFSSKNTLILFISTLILIPLVNLLTLKTFISNILISLAELGNILEGGRLSSLELSAMKPFLNSGLDKVLPYGQIFMYNLVYLVFLLGISSGILFLTLKLIKVNISFNDFISCLIVPSIILLISSIVLPFIFSIGLVLALIIGISFNLIFAITLYNNFKSLAPDFDILSYLSGLSVSLALILSNYFTVKMIISTLIESTIKGSKFF